MRAIGQFLGEQCVVTGILDRVAPSRRDSRCAGFCFRDCKVRGISIDFEIHEDHVWVWGSAESIHHVMRTKGFKIGSSVVYAGDIVRYRRRGGTFDFAVRYNPNLQNLSGFVENTLPDLSKAGLWEELLEILESGNLFNNYSNFSREEFDAYIQRQKQIAIANIERIKSGVGKRAVTKDRLFAGVGHRSRSTGFATKHSR